MSTNKIKDAQEFSAWYNDIIYKAELVDESPVRGCTVIRPYGWRIWELIVAELDRRIKAAGVENAYFPLFIPESYLKKEKEHVEGFSPELAVVTHAGGKELEEPLVVRPTSETIIYQMFSRWIKSYRDLPLKINQWANVVRWEMRTRPFIRTSEFLWQEGHTAHASRQEALESTELHRDLYAEFFKDFLAIPLLTGAKTDTERFAGADTTLTIEAMMQDGRALQCGTSHLLSENFPKVFGVEFQDKDGKLKTPWCSSWGTTTRMIGAVVMVHGDEKGLVLPPKIAPIQLMVVPIFKTEEQKIVVFEFANKIVELLTAEGVRTKADLDEAKSPGFKFNETEIRGIPLRIEVGPRDLEADCCTIVSRINEKTAEGKTQKATVQISALAAYVKTMLEEIQTQMFKKAECLMTENTFEVNSFEALSKQIKVLPGFYKVFWCNNPACEATLKDIQMSARVIIGQGADKKCFVCSKSAKYQIIVAKAY